MVFTKKDGSLNKAHVRYLESRLVGLGHEAKRAEVENGNAPHGSDGIETRDLRRDRLVPPIRRWVTIDALSLYSCGPASPSR